MRKFLVWLKLDLIFKTLLERMFSFGSLYKIANVSIFMTNVLQVGGNVGSVCINIGNDFCLLKRLDGERVEMKIISF